jgi:hypothetical protein
MDENEQFIVVNDVPERRFIHVINNKLFISLICKNLKKIL